MTFPSVTPALPPCPKRTDVNNAGGSVLDDHNPPKWVTFACRFTPLTVSEGQWNGTTNAFYDLFRMEDGMIVEHWDVIQPVPTEDLANTNGMFGGFDAN